MKLFFSDFLKFEDKILFSAVNYNGLFEYSLVTHETKLLFNFEPNEFGVIFSHTRLLKYQNSVWILPNNSKCLYEYSILEERLRHYDLPKEGLAVEYSLFFDGTIVNDKLYLLPCRYDGMLIFDLKARKFTNRIDLKKIFDVTSGLCCFKGIDSCNSEIYIASSAENKYIIFDTVTEKYEIRLLMEEYGGISHLRVKNGRVSIFGNNGKIGTYTLNGKKLEMADFSTKMNGPHFYDVCENGGIFFCTEDYEKRIAIYDGSTGETKELEYPTPKVKEFSDFWANALCINNDKDAVWFQSAYDGMLFALHENGVEKIGTIDWKVPDYELKKIWNNSGAIIKEQNGLGLPQLMKTLKGTEKY